MGWRARGEGRGRSRRTNGGGCWVMRRVLMDGSLDVVGEVFGLSRMGQWESWLEGSPLRILRLHAGPRDMSWVVAAYSP